MSQLTFPQHLRDQIEPYLPPPLQPTTTTTTTTTKTTTTTITTSTTSNPLPHLTLTYATSLDSLLSLHPALPTTLSGPLSKAMTHYLRTRHTAILIGSGTAIADDPSLFSRMDSVYNNPGREACAGQPRPVVLDRRGRWDVREASKVVKAAREGTGWGPWVVVGHDVEIPEERRSAVEGVGGAWVRVGREAGWREVLEELGRRGVESVMIEGGAEVINGILGDEGIRAGVGSVIVTVAPVYLGQGGVVVSPRRKVGREGEEVVRFGDVRWVPLGEDAVMCGRILR